MAQPLDVKRLLASGRQLTESGRQLGTDLVEQGRQATDQIAAVLDQLVNPGARDRIEEVRQVVRAEVEQQLSVVTSAIADHVATAQLAADRVAEMNRQRREQAESLREAVREEVQRQLQTTGLATGEDLAALRGGLLEDLRGLESRLHRYVESAVAATEVSERQGAPTQATPPRQPSAIVDPPIT